MENRLKEIIFSITNRCNLRCAMCQLPILNHNEMDTRELIGIIDDASKLHPESMVFSGGEPLLREDIFDLISFANKRQIKTCLASNGTLVDDRIASLLSSSGIGVVNISIEGPEQIHDSLRGEGNYKKAIRALEYLSRYKIETTIATIVCKNNYKSLPYIMELAREFGATTVKFQPFSEIFLIEKDKKDSFLLSVDFLEGAYKSIEKVMELSRKYKISTNPGNYLYNIPEYLCGLSRGNLNYRCSALWNTCPISHDGSVHLCWVLFDKIIGNVRENKLSEIWNSEKHQFLRESTVKKGCLGCMMSCYDYNTGKHMNKESFSLRIKRLKRLNFYKLFYYEKYQYLRYIFGKIINRIFYLGNFHQKNNLKSDVLKEITLAKQILKDKIRSMEKADKEEAK